jgi:hypothetical protein
VGRLLKQQGYRLQRTVKTLAGAHHPDRDAQFGYLNEQARTQLAAGQPVVRVDTNKKELVGRFANGGAEWQPAGEPEQVNLHDVPDPTLGTAIADGSTSLGARGAGSVSGPTTTPRRSRSRRCGAGGTKSPGSPPRRRSGCWSVPMLAVHRRPSQGVEDRAGPARRRDRASGHRGSPAGDLQAVGPLVRHAFHGEWNYTLHPAAAQPLPTARYPSTTLETWM